jgi:Icc-related predicted phosphoesterase
VRCHYLSDLHLESQEFRWRLPKGDVLIIAGVLCHARCLDPARTDPYCVSQRTRVLRFHELALANFEHVLLVAGNHDHYDGLFEQTTRLLETYLPGFIVLDNKAVEITGTHFFGSTLWSDFEGRSEAAMNAVRRRLGEFVFIKRRVREPDGTERSVRFRPEDALAEFDKAMDALRQQLAVAPPGRTVVITHHAPSLDGLNPKHVGNGLDGGYASNLDDMIASSSVPVWIHGHTHIKRTYRIGDTTVRANCRGFDGKDASANAFTPNVYFDI